MERIRKFLGEDWESLQNCMRTCLASEIALLHSVNENLLLNSGKQVRPALSLLMARATGGAATEDSVRYALAAELLHNATLFHDDVADKADTRRGRPTLRALMGPEASVLVGDFWLVRALRAIMDSKAGRDECLALFSRTLGDLAEGEMLQLQKASSCDTTVEDYLSIIYRKTSSLFVAASLSAAISVGADDRMRKAAADYGKYVGYAFQMKDDILDYDGGESVGKPLGVDILERKITLPLLGAFANAGAEHEARLRAAIRDNASEARDEVMEFVHANAGVEYARRMLDEYISKAVAALDALPRSEEKEWLARLARFIAIRNS